MKTINIGQSAGCAFLASSLDPPMVRKYCHGADYLESTVVLEIVTNKLNLVNVKNKKIQLSG